MPRTKQTTQTVRINGVRTILTTAKDGTVKAKPAGALEWELQAAAVRRLRSMPEYGKRFLLAGDMAAGKRGPTAQAQAVATGLTPGDPDLRIYLEGGQCGFIEYKTDKGRLSSAQVQRHASMLKLGHRVVTIAATSEIECADRTEDQVRRWFVANDNKLDKSR